MSKAIAAAKTLLAFLTLLYAALFLQSVAADLAGANGLLLADGRSALGGDFINIFSAGALAASGRAVDVYNLEAFETFQAGLIPAEIGLRLWAYPPTSLLVAQPLSLLGFWGAISVWTVLGLVVLAIGCRRACLSWLYTGIVVLGPASLVCIQVGQTGNFAAGLLLIALTASRRIDTSSAVAAALLTIKPQLGVLVPVLWFIRKQFAVIALCVCLTACLLALSVLAYGMPAWQAYVSETLPALVDLERHGDGPFVAMIPSVFMAVRILTHDATLAQWVHLAVAALVLVFAGWRLVRATDQTERLATALLATTLITPYLHIYDLTFVLCAALLHLQRVSRWRIVELLVAAVALIVAWGMPTITVFGNVFGIPLGPITLLGLLVMVARPVPLHRGLVNSETNEFLGNR